MLSFNNLIYSRINIYLTADKGEILSIPYIEYFIVFWILTKSSMSLYLAIYEVDTLSRIIKESSRVTIDSILTVNPLGASLSSPTSLIRSKTEGRPLSHLGR